MVSDHLEQNGGLDVMRGCGLLKHSDVQECICGRIARRVSVQAVDMPSENMSSERLFRDSSRVQKLLRRSMLLKRPGRKLEESVSDVT